MTLTDPRRDPLTPQFADWLSSLGVKPDDSAEPTALVAADDLLRVAALLKADGFMLLDSVGLDYSQYTEKKPARFCVLHNVFHPYDHRRLFLRVYVPESGELPTLYGIWKAANYLEREVYDLMGVVFTGHPDLRKVLTPDDLEGHPLRKDFPVGETPTLFRDGRFLDPASFRAGMSGQSAGLSGYKGALRRGESGEQLPPTAPLKTAPEGGPK
jgi:NADH-quinone oxidoreductase subunit C